MEKLAYNETNLMDTVVALGKFEGVHKGHMLLINKVLQLAHEAGKSSVVLSIDMPGTKRILTMRERDLLFDSLGIDYNISCEFNKKFASMKPEAFVKDVLVDRLHPAYIVIGNDFHFGRNRQGDVAMLEKLGEQYGFSVIAYDKLKEAGMVISSSYIRSEIEEGNIAEISRFLGRPYMISGIVQHGKQLGATIGFPTANLLPDPDKLLVPNGVYETCVWMDGRKYKGVTNVGDNPTTDEDHKVKIETHVLSFDGNLYGKQLKLDFVRKIRKEIKFDSIQALKNQIKSDTIVVAHQ